jgi:hypothetical protein
MKRIGATAVILGLLFAAIPQDVRAQGEHHWYNQFGNRSLLLSGAVIGGVSDMAAVYYNPARLATIEERGFLLSARAYQLVQTNIQDGLGENLDLEQSIFGGMPGLGAGVFTLPFLPEHSFAYSFLTRRKRANHFFLRVEGEGQLVESIPGEELFVGTVDLGSSVEEEWFGLSWAKQVSEKASLGLTAFGTALTRGNTAALDMRALDEQNATAVLLQTRGFNFTTYGLLFKAGLAVDLTPFQLGLTVTTPQIRILGSGSARFEDLQAGVDTTADGIADDRFTLNRQDDLKAQVKTPLSVGMGISWMGEKASLHLSGEWFSGVSKHSVMAAESFESQSSGQVWQYQVVDELKSVFNVGFGMEWHFTESFHAYGSVGSDASSAPDDVSRNLGMGSDINLNVLRADAIHLGGGVSIKTRWLNLTTGLTYAGSNENLERPLTLPSEESGSGLPGDDKANLSIKTWRILLGFSIPIADRIKEAVGSGDSGG